MSRSGAEVDADMKGLVEDAKALFEAAAALTDEKAEEARGRGIGLLKQALARAQGMQADAVAAGRNIAASADQYVKENPWPTIAAAAGVGLLVGVLLGRSGNQQR